MSYHDNMAAQATANSDSDDVMTIGPIDDNDITLDISTIDLPDVIDMSGSPYVISAGGSGGCYTIPTLNASWNNISITQTSPSIKVDGNADIQGKLSVNGVDFTELPQKIDAIMDRLSILVPDPEKLEKYQALRQAYEHYKTLEALCVDENKPTE